MTTATVERDGELRDVEGSARARWNPFTRIAFRFCFLYFGLFCVLYPQLLFAFLGWFGSPRWLPDDAVVWQVRVLEPVYRWVGRTVFGVDAELNSSGSGDLALLWVLVFCVLVVALVGTLLWSTADRRRPGYRRLAGWFLLFIRLCVAGQMLTYGMAKFIPTQMAQPGLTTLLQRYGDFSPMAVLWSQVGASPTYEILLGTAELVGGILLFIPRTATLGAMLALVDMSLVFVMDMTFDVPVKILSGHLMLMSLILLAPQARRLFDVLVLDRPSAPSNAPYPFHTRRSRTIAALIQIACIPWILVPLADSSWKNYHEAGDGRPHPPLYGIWSVTDFTRDGQLVPPLLTDENRWQGIVFDIPGVMSYQRMDGRVVDAALTLDARTRHIELAGGQRHVIESERQTDTAPKSAAEFTFQQSAPDRLRLDGRLDAHPVTIELNRVDLNSLRLRSGGFHWVQDNPSF
ncbi:DoxX family protein [Nocardia jiangxiensis]|uniref:DoxX family protein n=1 Tax=Nocardia jiangxiensis TaxID=282685 RepID=UPI000308688C|nr:DoxX family protein [Nocardia jiangxiensis]